MDKPKQVPHQLTANIKLLQKAVLVANGKAVIVKRSIDAKSRPEKWDLPGGNSEWPELNESRGDLYKEDLIREVQEETGITLDESVFDPNYLIYFDTYFEAATQMYSIIANWWIELPDNFDTEKIELSDEHTEYDWVTAEELEIYDFGGEKGAFIVESIETALSYSKVLNQEVEAQDHQHKNPNHKEDGCCGGNCKCKV